MATGPATELRSLRRALIALAAAGFIAGAVPLALALAGEGGHQRTLLAVLGPLTGWAFVGAGIVAWLRQPASSLGALMTAVGFSACLADLRVSTEPWVFICGLLFIAMPWATLYHLLLAFPSGVLRSGWERGLVIVSYASAAIAHPIGVLFQDTTLMGLPANPILISGETEVVSTITRTRFGLGLALLLGLGLVLAARWRSASPVQRRALAPVLATGGLVMALLGVWYAAVLAELGESLIEGLEEARIVVLATVPFAFLLGLLRSRVAGASAVSELVARLGEPARRAGLRDALADALGDPSLTLAYWLPEQERYVDAEGRAVKLPAPGEARVATPIESRGEQIAVIVHDAELVSERELVRAAGAAISLTLENERLDAELRARLEELRASRARIVESADAARRRLERDLHDGAQQRLVSVALELRLLEDRLAGEPDSAARLAAVRRELDQALAELRDLARGLHPTVLSDRGLGPALEDLARRAPLPVELVGGGWDGDRLPEAVESTAYFVVAEALTNVAKYARARRATVEIARADGWLRIEVSDDGVGGADPEQGSGLRGLADRVAAHDGRLEVRSPPGAGTTVLAAIPCQ